MLTFVPTGRQFAQQRLKKGAVIGGWVSSFYLLLPAGLTPFLGIYIDVYGKRIGFRTSTSTILEWRSTDAVLDSVPLRSDVPHLYAAAQVLSHCTDVRCVLYPVKYPLR